MDIEAIAAAFTDLHGQSARLLSDAFKLRPSFSMTFGRRPVNELENRLDTLFQKFVELDAELIRHAKPPSDLNTALRFAAQFGVYSDLRNSVRGLMTDVSGTLGSAHSRLDYLASVALSSVALILAIASIAIDIVL